MSMQEPFDLSADLPPPHEEEPASLRQDILDELADHLACSMRREAMFTSDENQLRANVLKRFGDPAQVARKLWRDAMWEKIMLQRLSFGLSLVSTTAVLVVGVLLWRAVEKSNQSQAAMLNTQQAAIQAMLDRALILDRVIPGNDAWAPLDVLLVSESGEPVAGNVAIKNAGRLNERPTLDLKFSSDSDGVARLGQVPWGEYDIVISLPEFNVHTTQNFYFRPGETQPLKIICPTTLPQSVVHFDVEAMKEQLRRGDAYLVTFLTKMRTGGREWMKPNSSRISALIDAEGHLVGRVLTEIPYDQKMQILDEYVSGLPVPEREASRLFDLKSNGLGNMDSYLRNMTAMYWLKNEPVKLNGTDFEVTVRTLSHLRILCKSGQKSLGVGEEEADFQVIGIKAGERGVGKVQTAHLHIEGNEPLVCKLDLTSQQWAELNLAGEEVEQLLARFWVAGSDAVQSSTP